VHNDENLETVIAGCVEKKIKKDHLVSILINLYTYKGGKCYSYTNIINYVEIL